MRINHNIASLNSYRQLTANTVGTSKSLEKLSSGLRINKAGDDAAGLAISEKMRGQIRGLSQAGRNAQDGISLIQTAEGALTETHSILQRMRELAVQGANDTLGTDDRAAIETELTELTNEIDRIGNTTEFNGKSLLTGALSFSTTGTISAAAGFDSFDLTNPSITSALSLSVSTATLTIKMMTASGTVAQALTLNTATGNYSLDFDVFGVKINLNNVALTAADIVDETITIGTSSAMTLQIGANTGANHQLTISIDDMRAAALSVEDADIEVDTAANAQTSITSIDAAITSVSNLRSKLGAYQNRLEHTIANLGASEENLTASESRVRDVDMAKEMMEFSKNNILNQAATAMLAQANQQPQGVLQLLR